MKARYGWLLLCLLCASAASAQSDAWRVKFVAGPYWMGASEVEMKVAPERLTFEAVNKNVVLKPLVVPMAAVTKVVYSRARFNRGKAMGANSMFPMVGGYPPQAAAAGNAGYLMVLAIASGMHGEKHFFTVEWEESGVEQELMVEATKQSAPALIEALGKAAGPKWMDLERRCTSALERIAKEHDKTFAIALPKAVDAGNFHLAAGNYQAVLLQLGAGDGELYVFANTVAPENLKAIMAVQVAEAIAGTTTTEVRLSSPSRLSEIRAAEWTLRVR